LTPSPIGPPEAEFLFMDHEFFFFFSKSSKSKGFSILKVLFQPNRTKDKEMRAKNQKPYNFEEHYSIILIDTLLN
jgi:hypothetical protein